MNTDRVERLLTRMREAEWTIERTSNGHYQAKAPDGTTVIHVPGKNGPGKSLQNTEARFSRWERDQEQVTSDVRYGCSSCEEKFTTVQGLRSHERVHYQHEVTCDLCGGKYQSGNGITKHMRAAHRAGPTFTQSAEKAEPPVEEAAVPAAEPEGDSLRAVSEDLLALASRVERLAQREQQDSDLRARLRDLLGV